MNKTPHVIAALVLLVIAGCGDKSDVTTDSRTVTFLHFNDLHAHLAPHWDKVRSVSAEGSSTGTEIKERGGIARLATLIQTIRAEAPASVLMNIGDTYHGGVEALYTLGNAIAAPVDALGIDIGVPGNWDFAYGPSITRRRYTGESVPGLLPPFGGEVLGPNYLNLAANVTITIPVEEAGQPFLPPTQILTVGGVQIGFIGLTSDIVPMMFEQLAVGLEFAQGEEAYRALIDEHASDLRASGAEIVVVMSELGIHKDYRLAQVVAPGAVDVFFSAHTHEVTTEPLTSQSGALVVEAGNDGYLGRMDVTIENDSVIERRWELIPVSSDIPENAEMKALVDAARAPFLAEDVDIGLAFPVTAQRLNQPIDTVVGHTEFALDRRDALESSFNNFVTDVFRHMSETDVVISPGFRFDAIVSEPGPVFEDNTVAMGDITLEDVYRFFPAPYSMARGEASVDVIQGIVEELLTNVYSATAFSQGGGWVDGLSGVQTSVDLDGSDGDRVRDFAVHTPDSVFTGSDKVTVTGCIRPLEAPGTLCSHTGFSNVEPFINEATGSPWTPVDLFIQGLQSFVPMPRSNIVELSGRESWPDALFIQPLQPLLSEAEK